MKTPLIAATVVAAAVGVAALAQQRTVPRDTLTAVDGIRVGHFTLSERPTGCTVILVDGPGAVGGIAQRGPAPGTRETDLLDPLNMVERVNAIVLSGGSAYGLDAAQGAMRYLEEQKIGFPIAGGVVPIVPAAVIFDLPFGGKPQIRPTADCGYKAASTASASAVEEGNVGVGAGATVGKLEALLGARGGATRRSPMKAGVGSAAIRLGNGLVVSALAVANAVGDIIDPMSGKVVAGVRNADGSLADARLLLRSGNAAPVRVGENTTLVVVATNAQLTKVQATRVALMADDGLARAVNPVHTQGDGDTVFVLATGRFTGTVDLTTVGGLAAEVVAEAIVRAATEARSSGGLAAARDTGTVPARFR
ncbi:MAG: P1 family peptidase [Vicinamibacterales bacterium]